MQLKAGTAKNGKYYPIHILVQKHQHLLESLLAFSAITGSDNTSYLAGHTEKSVGMHLWITMIFSNTWVKENLTSETMKDAEKFICKIYKMPNISSADQVCTVMFAKAHNLESLPPSSNATKFHVQCSHYQTAVMYSIQFCLTHKAWDRNWRANH